MLFISFGFANQVSILKTRGCGLWPACWYDLKGLSVESMALRVLRVPVVHSYAYEYLQLSKTKVKILRCFCRVCLCSDSHFVILKRQVKRCMDSPPKGVEAATCGTFLVWLLNFCQLRKRKCQFRSEVKKS